MLGNSKSKLLTPAVKLYPRLAQARAPVRELDRPLAGRTRATVPVLSPRETELVRLRGCLLRMILDNERVRRNNWRPNAS